MNYPRSIAIDPDDPTHLGGPGARPPHPGLQLPDDPAGGADLRAPDRRDRPGQHRPRQLPLAGRHRVLHAARRAPGRHHRRPHGRQREDVRRRHVRRRSPSRSTPIRPTPRTRSSRCRTTAPRSTRPPGTSTSSGRPTTASRSTTRPATRPTSSLDTSGIPPNRFGRQWQRRRPDAGPGRRRHQRGRPVRHRRDPQPRSARSASTGEFLGRWGSTYGPNIYDFRGAIGIDADANGLLYVTDTGNDRIQVFNPNLGRQYEQIAPPTAVGHRSGAVVQLPLSPVTFSGTATDDIAVGHVEIAVQDYTTGPVVELARTRAGRPTKTYANAAWSGANATSVNWRWVFLGVSAEGRYLAEVRTRDHNANFAQTIDALASPCPVPPRLRCREAPVADNVRPTGASRARREGEIVLTGAPIDVHGRPPRRRRRRPGPHRHPQHRQRPLPQNPNSRAPATASRRAFAWQTATLARRASRRRTGRSPGTRRSPTGATARPSSRSATRPTTSTASSPR